MSSLFEQFLVESRELVEAAGGGLLRLEKDVGDRDAVNEVFRAFHTLKGATGLFDWPPFTRLVHVAEDLLDAVRVGRTPATPELVDRLLAILDQCSRWIDAIETHEALPADADEQGRRLGAALSGTTGGTGEASAGRPAGFDWLDGTGVQDARPLTAVAYDPDPECFFNGDDPLALVRRIPELVWLRIEPAAPWPADLAGFDPYRCVLRFRALSAAGRADIAPLFRAAPDQVRFAAVPPAGQEPAPTPAASIAAAPPPESALAMAEAILREQRRALGMDADPAELDGRLASVARTAAGVLAALGRADEVQALATAAEAARAVGRPGPLANHLATLLATFGTSGAMPATAPAAEGRAVRRALRVEPERIDRLMALVGELVVAKNRLPFVVRETEDLSGGGTPARHLRDAYDAIDSLTDALQDAVLGLRMLPLAQVFQPLPRLVRDLAQRLGKRADLRVSGEGTEADKDVLAVLGEPLIHLVRNALDHGIETPEARRAAGKPETGTIRVEARQERDSVIVEVADDGAGIDTERVRRKAVANGAVDPARAAALSEEEALALVLLPGVSTAATVTDVSGRGVGMDAVRSAVESAGGRIGIASTPGAGTRVRLTLPLTMVITPIMVVAAGGALFGIPTGAVAEVARVPASEVRRVKHAESFVLRGAVVPLFRLHRLLELSAPAGRSGDGETVLVLRIDREPVGLAVDGVRERAEVVLKPLSGVLAGLRGYSGTAELGDGRLLPVINLRELL
ncbi:MAG TPA: chemotaxis protein CheA [Azospirillum sp.]|nr:chemotaxis protein CheA [Azospirillum sp.]